MRNGVAVLTVLNLLGVVQGLLLALALVTIQRGNRTANRLLATFVAVTSLQLIGAILFTTRYIVDVPHLSRVHHPFLFLTAPLLFLYIQTLTSQRGFERRDWLHFLPALLCAIYLTPFFLQSAAYKIANTTSPDYERWYYTRHALAFTQGAIYLIFILKALLAYTRKLGAQRTVTEKAVLLQIRVLVIAMSIIFLGGLIRLLLRDRSLETNLIIPLCSSIMVYVVAWLGLTKPEALAGFPEPALQVRKYERSTLTSERAEEYLTKLLQLMESQKPYTDGDLTLQKLAGLVAISPQHLSQVINERLNQSFSDFINSYRIEEAKRLLTDPARKHYSILAVAEEVGFNSKSTFNAAFKKHTGLTPSDFRENASFLKSA